MSGAANATGDSKRPIRKFNPGLLQSDEEVIEQFVVRQHEFGVVRDVLRGNIDAPSCQHVLVVAPRGRGKTMLLARVVAEIRRDSEFDQHLLPVRFMEESQEIYGLADLWMETLFHLAREITSDRPAFASELSETHAALSARWREGGLEGMARAAVLDAADRLDRRLVLMVENVQSLFAASGDEFGWELRAVLQSVPQVMLVASATSRFKGLEDARAPFFELFRVVHLEPLDTEDCGRLWTVVTGQALHTHEIRPIEILTGGSPRLIVVVAAFARHESLRELMEELVTLVDEHTEYFRGHLESLPRNERRVFVSLIDLWQASSTGEIAARARLDVRVVSTMLGRLVERGAVTVVPVGGGTKRLYTATERLYSIYYKLRRERDETAVVEALIHFMVAFYDVGRMYMASEQLLRDALGSTAIQAGIDRALARRPLPENLRSRMKWDKVERTSEKVRDRRRIDALSRLQDEIQACYENEDWSRVLEMVEQYDAAGWLDSASGWERDQGWAHLAHLRSDAHYCLKQFSEVITIGDEFAERFGDTRDATLWYRFSSVALNRAAAYYGLGNYVVARSESRNIVDRFGEHGSPWYDLQVAAALLWQARAENKLGDPARAVALLDDVLERYGASDDAEVQLSVAGSMVEKAEIVRLRYEDHRRSAEIYGEAIERFGHSDHAGIRARVNSACMNLSFAYGSSGDFEKELASYDAVIARLAGTEVLAGENWSILLALMFKSRRLAELGRAEEALATCDEGARWIERRAEECSAETRKWIEWHLRGTRALALMATGESVAAMDAFRSAYAQFQPYHELAMGDMLRLVPELVAAGAAERDVIAVLVSDERNARTLQPMIIALRQRSGESVRAPAEVLEVAADLVKSVDERGEKGVMPGFMHPMGK